LYLCRGRQVEELYETYCIQWRLCQGAVNMKQAFSLSPSSRASRESLLELNRNHRHSLEDMCAMEGELEILLGELQIKMKGLIGFARLCPGDQYEVLIRLGRQRWRIRGRIQTDDRQLWDEEEMVFLPHIHENFEIKVTEVKGLSSILVGMVTCKSADFFMVHPQLMVVDITELGTIKLQLEVVWNPFDSGEVKPVMSSASRQSIQSRKGLMYNWTPPNTPSFTEKYFLVRCSHPPPPPPLASHIVTHQANYTKVRSIFSLVQSMMHQIYLRLYKTIKDHLDVCKSVYTENSLYMFCYCSYVANLFRMGLHKESTVKGLRVMSQDTALSSEGQEAGYRPKRGESEDRHPLSTGDYTLDQALEVHLTMCTALLRVRRHTMALHQNTQYTLTLQAFWEECCGSDAAFCCPADVFLRTMRKRFMHKVKAKLPGQADTVFGQLLQQVQSSSVMVPLALATADRVTVFQLQVYLSRRKLMDFGEHISHLSKEVHLVSCLESPKRRRTLKKLKGKRISELQPMGQTLQLLAKLLTDANYKVATTATSCLCRASGFKSFRSKALVYYTWLLRDSDTQIQQQSCLALKCLKVTYPLFKLQPVITV
uniref:FAM65 N-terminal domain-containing protein n=1 Tax=Electrophorus electricus TaxID=8005 RepID=A0A4W4DZT0_ELEEL